MEIGLKWIIIAIAAGIVIFGLSMTTYINFTRDNLGNYSQALVDNASIISKYSSNIDTFATTNDINSITDTGKLLFSLPNTFLTAVNIGLTSITSLVTALVFIPNMIRDLLTLYPMFTAILSLLITVFTIYVVYRFISEVRGITR